MSGAAGAHVVGVGLLGAAPHLLHHAGPVAGAALVAGASGQIVFGLLGLVASLPLLHRMRRRSGSWRRPVFALAAMAAGFALSSTVVGPALTSEPAGDRHGQTSPSVAGHVGEHTDHGREGGE